MREGPITKLHQMRSYAITIGSSDLALEVYTTNS